MKLPPHISLILVAVSGFVMFALEYKLAGYAILAAALLTASTIDRRLLRDLSLIAVAMLLISSVPITTDISYEHLLTMGLALSLAIALPYLLSRYVYGDHAITFPFGFREPWTRSKWLYIAAVGVLGYAILPVYMINTGVYLNWPAASDPSSIIRLFLGTNALGIWDELFFICTVFVIFQRYVSFWWANILQAALFTSFLFELGFTSYGPVLIYLFALSQGYIFKITHSLFYVICIHLLLDLVLFLVLIHAHNPTWIDIFIY